MADNNTQQSAGGIEKHEVTQIFARRIGIPPEKVADLLLETAFRQVNGTITPAEIVSILIVANEYNLNPFTGEIYALQGIDKIIPVVGIDGWSRIMNAQPAFNGMDFIYSDVIVKLPEAQPCASYVECVIHRKDRDNPVIVREYLEENYLPKEWWNKKTARSLRHRAVIQCARYAFGLVGIYDQDEAEGMIRAETAKILGEEETAVINTTAIKPSPAVHSVLKRSMTGGLAAAKNSVEELGVGQQNCNISEAGESLFTLQPA